MNIIDPLLKLISHHPVLDQTLNRHVINHFAEATPARPRAFSLWSPKAAPCPVDDPDYIVDYTSWPALTNKRYSGRHLKPADPAYTNGLPRDAEYKGPGQIGDVTALFSRNGAMKESRS